MQAVQVLNVEENFSLTKTLALSRNIGQRGQ